MKTFKLSIGKYYLPLDPEAEGNTLLRKVDNSILSGVRSQKTSIVKCSACLFIYLFTIVYLSRLQCFRRCAVTRKQ